MCRWNLSLEYISISPLYYSIFEVGNLPVFASAEVFYEVSGLGHEITQTAGPVEEGLPGGCEISWVGSFILL